MELSLNKNIYKTTPPPRLSDHGKGWAEECKSHRVSQFAVRLSPTPIQSHQHICPDLTEQG